MTDSSTPSGNARSAGDLGQSADAEQVDLSPRLPRVARKRSKWPALTVLLVLTAVVIGLIWYLVTSSTSFQEADDAVAKRGELGDQRFQLLGSPLDNTVTTQLDGSDAVAFTVQFDGVLVDVVNIGSPAAQFQAAVPVVLEGQWVQGDAPVESFEGGANDGWYFRSDRMLIKHDNDYTEDRIEDAEQRGQYESEDS